jgi:hypothetical protein
LISHITLCRKLRHGAKYGKREIESLGQFEFFAFGNDSLGGLDQIADAQGVGLGMAVTLEGVGAAAGLNQDVRPNDSGLDVDGSDLGNTNADFVFAKPRAFVADDGHIRDLNDGAKKEISFRPPAGFKRFRRHGTTSPRISNSSTQIQAEISYCQKMGRCYF